MGCRRIIWAMFSVTPLSLASSMYLPPSLTLLATACDASQRPVCGAIFPSLSPSPWMLAPCAGRQLVGFRANVTGGLTGHRADRGDGMVGHRTQWALALESCGARASVRDGPVRQPAACCRRANRRRGPLN